MPNLINIDIANKFINTNIMFYKKKMRSYAPASGSYKIAVSLPTIVTFGCTISRENFGFRKIIINSGRPCKMQTKTICNIKQF